MSERTPARDSYDALVDLHPGEGEARVAYALVKRTYRLSPQPQQVLDLPVALYWNVRDPDLQPRWMPGTDYWFFKPRADVAVKGSAYAAGGRAARRSQVVLSVGDRTKRIEVYGKRVIEWFSGHARPSEPEPFDSVEVCIQNAYGGAYPRVPAGDGNLTVMDQQRLLADRSGHYPRNPFGKGYVVLPDRVDGVELPNLEDPDHPLGPHNLVVRDPREWWMQPLPWTLDWTHGLMFPRSLYLGENAFPVPDDAELEEVRRGLLAREWRAYLGSVGPDATPPADFFQEGALGQSFWSLAPGTPIHLFGMHPEREGVQLVVPSPPKMELTVENKKHELQARLINVLIEPDADRVSCTWSGICTDLPRAYIPGVHASIPISLSVDGDRPIEYETPLAMRARLDHAAGQSRQAHARHDARPALEEGPREEIFWAAENPQIRDPFDGFAQPATAANDECESEAPPPRSELTDSFENPPIFDPSHASDEPNAVLSPPSAASMWRADGFRTEQIVVPEQRVVPPTLVMHVKTAPTLAVGSMIPETREIALPDLPHESTYVLSDAQMRGEEPAPLSSDRKHMMPARGIEHERSQRRGNPFVLSDAELSAVMKMEPVPELHGEPTRILETAPGATEDGEPLDLEAGTTQILSGAPVQPDDSDRKR